MCPAFQYSGAMINTTVIVLSLGAQYTPFYDTIAFRPSIILDIEAVP